MNKSHRRPGLLPLFIGALALSGCCVAGSLYVGSQAYANYIDARSAMSAKSGLIVTQIEDAEFLDRSADLINRLRDEGKLGSVQKLTWLETLSEIAAEVPIDNVQTEMTPVTTQSVGSAEVKRVDVSVYGRLLHDGKIETFFNALDNRAPSGYSVRSLEVITSPGEAAGTESHQELEMIALISWYAVLPAGSDQMDSEQ